MYLRTSREKEATMRLLLRILRWTLLGVLILLLVGGGGGYLWLRGSLAQTSGSIIVDGLAAPVEIVRDVDAVPHIRGKSDADAMFGLGYAHAQDRLWQMEFQRRVGNGRLSEFAGPSQLNTDKFLRTLGVARAAASAWAHLSPQERAPIEAYVAGVNAFLQTHHGRALPIEFSILGFEPEPWRPVDVLVWGKMMAWDEGGNWTKELLKVELAARLGAEKADQLTPAYVAGGPIIIADGAASTGSLGLGAGGHAHSPNPQSPIPNPQFGGLLAIDRALQDQLGMGGPSIGSNNWVVGGARTVTGKPLLASDPHMSSSIPNIWYLAHVTGGQIDAIGATMPGMPGVIIGHNSRIAWGITNTGPDVQDLYIEHLNDRNQVEHNGAWEPLQIVPEVIKVKGQPDVPIQVRISRHGPLISDVTAGTGQPLSFRWTSLDEEDHTLDAFMRLDAASNWADFTAALAQYKAPMQNFVYADVDGNIGYYAPGAVPIRAGGDGSLPAPGWTDANDWMGYIPFDRLPHVVNPPQGYIVTANNPPLPESYPYLMTTSWETPYRAARIIELIEGKPKLTADDIAAMQADVRSSQARALLPALLEASAADSQSRDAIAFLSGWDGTIAGESAQAAVYEAWYQQIGAHIFADELGDKLWADYSAERNYVAMALSDLLRANRGGWCDDVGTSQPETCADTLGAALRDGLAQMAQAQGSSDFTTWRWDRVHHAMFPHTPFDSVPALKPIFSRSIPNGGDAFTVNVGPVRAGQLYNQYNAPGYREVIDLSDLDASRFVQPVGQSGNLLSRNYSNLIARWQCGAYLPMRFQQATIEQAAPDRLVLEPQ
jgi:penicillin amidase